MEFFNNWWGFVSTRWDQVQIGLIEHSVYVVSVLGVASVFAIVLGVVTRRSPLARELSLAISSVFLTIPSLALFTIFIPLVGLGFAPSFLALLLYSLLPILRNTIAGLDGIDSSVLEAAKGMGLTPTQVLLRVQLPLAWPVIIAGIRVSAMSLVAVSVISSRAVLPGFPCLTLLNQSGREPFSVFSSRWSLIFPCNYSDAQLSRKVSDERTPDSVGKRF